MKFKRILIYYNGHNVIIWRKRVLGKERMKRFLKKTIRALLPVIFPDRCPFCDEVMAMGSFCCEECADKISLVAQPYCCKCGQPLWDTKEEYCMDCGRKQHAYVTGRAVYVYQGPVKASLYRFKYAGRREYAACYGHHALKLYGGWIRNIAPEAIVPVPLHSVRQRKRGYNQAEVFARILGEALDIPVRCDLIRRSVNTCPQKGLNDTERKKNLKKAFTIAENIVQLRRVLLVDDIYTTGSTVDAVSALLTAGGIQQVYVLCISIGRGY